MRGLPNNLTANPAPAAIGESEVMQCGTMRAVEGDGTQYALQDGASLKKFAAGAKIGAFRVYYTGLTGESAAAIFVGETTMIGTIRANGEIDFEDAVIYNLQGQRVTNVTRGIYIVNGKKVVVK